MRSRKWIKKLLLINVVHIWFGWFNSPSLFLNIFRFCSRNEKSDIFEIYVTLAYSKSTICKDKNSSIIPKFKLKKEGRIKWNTTTSLPHNHPCNFFKSISQPLKIQYLIKTEYTHFFFIIDILFVNQKVGYTLQKPE